MANGGSMLTAKSIIKIMKMRAALGIPPDGEGSCFGVTDPSRTRDAFWERQQQYRGTVSASTAEVISAPDKLEASREEAQDQQQLRERKQRR